MKKQISALLHLSFWCLLCSSGGLHLQNLYAQSTYDLQFANSTLDCAALPPTFCTTLQIRAATNAPDFAIGSHTFFFSYSTSVLNYPVYTPTHFYYGDPCDDGQAAYSTSAFFAETNLGEANITTLMRGASNDNGCPIINNTEWTDIGELCFMVLGENGMAEMAFDADLTVLNLNNDTPEHQRGALGTLSMPISCNSFTDSDGDGLTDDYEASIGTDINLADSDMDGLTDLEEAFVYSCNPLEPDSDMDGLTDFDEVIIYESDPNDTDSDNDTLEDGEEVNVYQTDPTEKDSDNDNLNDNLEVTQFNTDPNNPDTDGDGLFDGTERLFGSNPLNPDTDEDGLLDGEEDMFDTEILNSDSDGDGLLDGEEVHVFGTNPSESDTDMDGLEDGEEIDTYGTSPLTPDTDGDNLMDMDELTVYNTDPTKQDTDLDGLWDGAEIDNMTDPNIPDSDMDGLTDGDEVNVHESNPLVVDSDGDGLEDGDEVNIHNSSPILVDTDMDGLRDNVEVLITTNPNDPDTDGDGVGDIIEAQDGGSIDTDFDGIINALDDDDDDDGILTIDEDTNGDGDWSNDDDNNNGIPDYLDPDVVSVNNTLFERSLRFYLNPVQTNLYVEMLVPSTQNQEFTIKIYDLKGTLLKQRIFAQQSSISVADLAKGAYLVSIENEGSEKYAKRIIKY